MLNLLLANRAAGQVEAPDVRDGGQQLEPSCRTELLPGQLDVHWHSRPPIVAEVQQRRGLQLAQDLPS